MPDAMPNTPQQAQSHAFGSLDAAAEAAIAACDGDPLAAVRALIVANSSLHKQLERERTMRRAAISRGFVRGREP